MNATHLLTEEVARRWKISARTLERWRYVGTGPTYRRIGGRVVYTVAEIERFEQSCDVENFQ
jgi:DNA-binding transcriptional MerR regulator